MKRFLSYCLATPFQRIGIILFCLGVISLTAWATKNQFSLRDFFDIYYLPRKRDNFFFHLYLYLIPAGLLMSVGYIFLKNLVSWVRTGKVPSKEIIRAKSPHNIKDLHFKSNLEAFQFAVSLYQPNFKAKSLNFGIVQKTEPTPDGSFHILVQLANSSGTTLVMGYNNKYAQNIQKGNLVYWGFNEFSENTLGIEAIGYIVATLHPQYSPLTGKWKIKEDLTK